MSVLATPQHLTNSGVTNFYYSFLFLPREKRQAIEAVYAFARRGDDIVDSDLPAQDAARELALYRESLDACYAEESAASRPSASRFAGDASLRALSEAVHRFKISRQYFDDLILGLEMDLPADGKGVRYETFDDLAVYCYRVAGAIGQMAIEIFGCRNPHAREYAKNLGQALQLVNILRDVQSDAQRGRIYLPMEDLEQFGVRPEGLAKGEYTSGFVELMQLECDRARNAFDRARIELAQEDRRSMIAAEIMAAIYWRLLKRIQARAYNVFGERVHISKPVKLWTALSVYLGADWHK